MLSDKKGTLGKIKFIVGYTFSDLAKRSLEVMSDTLKPAKEVCTTISDKGVFCYKITNVNLKENTVTLEYRASSRYRKRSNNTGPGSKTVAIPFAYLQSLSQMKGAANANGAETLRDKIKILVDYDAETTGKIKELAKKF